jgi:hypothetical protein
MRLVKLAASITPEAKPSPRSEILLKDPLKNSIGTAPKRFIIEVKRPAKAPRIAGSPPDMP